jgi:cellulose synthase/poly-beta-1,6-N-acetylglucosamine synthase-like glycosyltransferase
MLIQPASVDEIDTIMCDDGIDDESARSIREVGKNLL